MMWRAPVQVCGPMKLTISDSPDCVHAGLSLIPSSRAASMHSTSSTEMMLAEGFLDHPGCDVESGVQPLITPSGMGAEMRYESYLTMKGAALSQFPRWRGALGACCVSPFHTLSSHAPDMAFVGRERSQHSHLPVLSGNISEGQWPGCMLHAYAPATLSGQPG